jgi:hypothetical protein
MTRSHSALKDAIDREFAASLLEPAVLCRDAVLVRLHNEVTIELRVADASEYSIGWRWGDAQLRIDTAPLHRQLATFPNHLHDSDGQLRADPLTQPGIDPWDNVRAVIASLLEDPLLQGAGPGGRDRMAANHSEPLASAGSGARATP